MEPRFYKDVHETLVSCFLRLTSRYELQPQIGMMFIEAWMAWSSLAFSLRVNHLIEADAYVCERFRCTAGDPIHERLKDQRL